MATLAMSALEQGATIRDLEIRIETLLNDIRRTSSSTSVEQAMKLVSEARELFTAPGMLAVAQLEEDGRKKRSTAAAANWRFESGEIVLYFEHEPQRSSTSQGTDAIGAVVAIPQAVSTGDSQPGSLSDRSSEEPGAEKISKEIQECCEALESAGADRDFVALKRFRDLVLPAHAFPWAVSETERQRVLNEGIGAGAIQVKKIPNPKSPSHPTTVISVNRDRLSQKRPSRFQPVTVIGEPVSATILRDRG